MVCEGIVLGHYLLEDDIVVDLVKIDAFHH